jgi:hypothetical protein
MYWTSDRYLAVQKLEEILEVNEKSKIWYGEIHLKKLNKVESENRITLKSCRGSQL